MSIGQKRYLHLAILGSVLISSAWTVHATEYFVTTSGLDSNTGTNWAEAFLTISNAVAQASASDTITVSNGTYNITDQIVIDKALTIRSYMNGVTGGLANATNTIIDRGGGGGYLNDKSRVLNCSAAGTVLDGLTLTGAGYVYASYSGGGVYMPNGGTIQNCIARDNVIMNGYTTGAGIYIADGTVSNCIVKNNRTAARGGGTGIWATNSLIIDCYVHNNTNGASGSNQQGWRGAGGIFAEDTQVINCRIADNEAWSYYNNTYPGHGGGILAVGNTLIRNCLITGNSQNYSGYHGGGVYGGTIENCTIVSNTASSVTSEGGGIHSSTVTNSIVLGNTTGLGDSTKWNYDASSTFTHSCSLPKPSGVGNIDTALFVDEAAGDYQLLPCSAVNSGTNLSWMTGAIDLLGTNRILGGTVDMGCYERVIGDFECYFVADVTTVLTPSNVIFTATVAGTNTNVTAYAWDFGDGQTSNGATLTTVTNTYSNPGLYTVTLTVTNDSSQSAWSTNVDYIAAWGTNAYVSQTSPSPSVPYHTWTNAAHTVGDAVVPAPDGATIVITNGTYSIDAQIIIQKPLTLIGYGGGVYGGLANATNTIIDRGGGGAYQNDKSRVLNCSVGGILLDGLTLKGAGYVYGGYYGGGVYMPNGGTVQNCIVTENTNTHTYTLGSGIYIDSGTVSNCIVTDNYTGSRGGGSGIWATNTLITHSQVLRNINSGGYDGGGGIFARSCQIINCEVSGNTSSASGASDRHGGGIYADSDTLIRNCLIANNTQTAAGYHGGGVAGGIIENCTVVSNRASSATSVGGGVYGSTVTNSIVLLNETGSGDTTTWNYNAGSTFFHSASLPLPSGSGNISAVLFVDPDADNYRLQLGPGVDAGTNQAWMAAATDLDGSPRTNGVGLVVDMGAYERAPADGLECSLQADETSVVVPSGVVFTASVGGTNTNVTVYAWDFGDGQTASGATLSMVTNTYSTPGLYTVTLSVTNDAAESYTATNAAYIAVWGSNAYVSASSASPSVPYHTWTNAAHTVADAVAAAPAGRMIVITNDTYDITAEIRVNKALTLVGFDGTTYGGRANATNTIIDRGGGGSYGNDKSRVMHCSAAGSVLDGLTIMGGGYVYAGKDGGGVYMPNGGTVQNCIVQDNQGPNQNERGGGIYIESGTISNSIIRRNYTANRAGGGGIWASNSVIVDCEILSNTNHGGYGHGGGIYAEDTEVRNSLVADNLCVNDHGSPDGAGIYLNGGSAKSCTVVNNNGQDGAGGIHVINGGTVVNTIAYSNFISGAHNNLNTMTGVEYSCSTNTGNTSNSNTTDNPIFRDFAAGDYRLHWASPCINAGMNQAWMTGAYDLWGIERIVDTTVDMGAYEARVGVPGVDTSTGATVTSSVSATLHGELTNGFIADAWICWGDNDAGTNSIGDWDNAVSMGMIEQDVPFSTEISVWYGIGYHYRVYVTNSVGDDWSGVVDFFTRSPTNGWTPEEIDLFAWYDASDTNTITLAAGNNVSQLADKSTNARHMAQGTASLQPETGVRTINDLNVLDFVRSGTGSNEYLITSSYAGVDNTIHIGVFASDADLAENPLTIWQDSFGLRANRLYLGAGKSFGVGPADITFSYLGGTNIFGGVLNYDASENLPLSYAQAWNNGTQAGADAVYDHALTAHTVAARLMAWNNINTTTDGAFGELVMTDGDNSVDTRQKLEGYLAWKWGLEGKLPAGHPYTNSAPGVWNGAFGVSNTTAANITGTNADLRADLYITNSVFDVTVYWSTSNNLDSAAWLADGSAGSAAVGRFTNVMAHSATGSAAALAENTFYYYTFVITNECTSIWAASNSMFSTLGLPTVDNDGGATILTETSATVRGELTAGGAAVAWICWGTSDAGTVSTGDWQNVEPIGAVDVDVVFSTAVTGLGTNQTYWYRCYVTNSYGVDWSDAPESFNGTPADAGGGGSGDANIAIYREATGGDATASTVKDMTWDTTVRQDAAYELQGDNKSIRILEDGRYLCMYNLGVTLSSRLEVAASLSLGGSSLGARGKGSGYTRDGTGPNAWISAAAIFDASASDNLILQYQRTGNNEGALLANASGITLVKLNDADAFLAVEEVGGGQTHNTDLSFVAITFDSNTVASTDTSVLDHSTSADTDQILIKAAGKYLITYSLEFQNTAGTRRNGNTRLTLDGTEIEASRVSGYTRADDGCADPACSWIGIIDVAAASPGTPAVLRLQACSEGANTTASLLSQQGSLCITKLSDSVKIIRTALAADVAVEGAEFAMSWPTPDEIDDDVFTYNGGTPSRIEVDVDGDYLFLASFYTYRNSNTTRSVPRWRWRRNGTITYNYGIFSQYNRGDEGSEDTWSAGQAGGFVGTNMTAGGYIEVLTVDDYNTGDVNNDYKLDRTGLQAIQISSILSGSGPIANLAPTAITNNQATLNATLSAESVAYTVYVHWGVTNGSTNVSGWVGSAEVGSWTNVASTNISYLKTGLTGNSTNWYTFRASNATEEAWAEPSWMFTTLPSGTGPDNGSIFTLW